MEVDEEGRVWRGGGGKEKGMEVDEEVRVWRGGGGEEENRGR